jgi:hypothetical protein
MPMASTLRICDVARQSKLITKLAGLVDLASQKSKARACNIEEALLLASSANGRCACNAAGKGASVHRIYGKTKCVPYCTHSAHMKTLIASKMSRMKHPIAGD